MKIDKSSNLRKLKIDSGILESLNVISSYTKFGLEFIICRAAHIV